MGTDADCDAHQKLHRKLDWMGLMRISQIRWTGDGVCTRADDTNPCIVSSLGAPTNTPAARALRLAHGPFQIPVRGGPRATRSAGLSTGGGRPSAASRGGQLSRLLHRLRFNESKPTTQPVAHANRSTQTSAGARRRESA